MTRNEILNGMRKGRRRDGFSVKLTNIQTGESCRFDSFQEASLAIGKTKNYIGECLRFRRPAKHDGFEFLIGVQDG